MFPIICNRRDGQFVGVGVGVVVERRRASASPSNHSALRHPGRTHPSNTCRANRAASPPAWNVGYIQLCVWAGGLGLNLSVGPLFTAWRLGTLVSERCPAPQWEGLIVRRESILARIWIQQMFLVVPLNNTLCKKVLFYRINKNNTYWYLEVGSTLRTSYVYKMPYLFSTI